MFLSTGELSILVRTKPSPLPPKISRPYLKSCLCLKGSEQGQIGWWLDTIH